jgi:integrase
VATIRKRTWKNKSGKHTCYEITYSINGKQYKKGGYQSLLEAQIDLPNVVNDYSTDIKFSVLANMFLTRHCVLKCKQSTIDLYERYINAHFDYLKRKIVRDITHKEIENIIFNLKAKGLSNVSINKLIQLLRVIFNYGIDNKLISKNPILKTDRLTEEKKEISVLDEQQIQQFLDVAKTKNIKTYTLLATALYTGIRRGELLALEWSDIDFKNNQIKINKQVYKKEKVPTKNNKHRTVDIPDNLIEILREYKKNQTVLSKIVFCNSTGGYMHPSILERRHFSAILKLLNEKVEEEIKIRFHDLRHTYATFLLSKGVPIKYVQEQLGHSSAKMTLDVYASYMPSVKFEALNILNNLHKNIENNSQIEHK